MSILRILIAVFSTIFLICAALVLLSLNGFFGELSRQGENYYWGGGITKAGAIILLAFWPGVIAGLLALITGFIYFITLKKTKR